MMNWLAHLFSEHSFLPHRFCLNNSPELVTVSVISNGLIFLAYFSIPLTLAYFYRRRKESHFKLTALLFAGFILACGTTHILHILTYWQPWYGVQAVFDVATAVISVYTAIYLWWLLPHWLSLPSHEQLLALNQQLQHEIAERKQAEMTLQEKTQALQRSNTDLEQFAYSVSHDMRQPLRAVSGHLQFMERDLRGKLDEENQLNLQFALEGAKRMDAMIVSLLDYSRVGRKTDSKRELATQAILDEALAFLATDIQETQATLNVTGHWPTLVASADELSRLFLNIIGNALKYHEAHQRPEIDIHSTVSAGTWQITVRDNGIGIPPQQIPRLFQFFSRLQARNRFEGTGMGLALCRRIVEHHGGRIGLESAGAGHGCCVTFTLPRREKI